ncbi:S8 family serine peptidase, partial [Verrucomicrobiales bacterium]|nr:S8 family serine peptidase [Verrucomicrobiales bacterium]
MAPASDILSIRVLDAEGLGNSYTVASGIVTAVDSGASVINLSVGGYSDSTVLREAVAYAIDSGVAVVAAAGNDGSNAPSYPAAYEGVVGVSAVDAEGQ